MSRELKFGNSCRRPFFSSDILVTKKLKLKLIHFYFDFILIRFLTRQYCFSLFIFFKGYSFYLVSVNFFTIVFVLVYYNNPGTTQQK